MTIHQKPLWGVEDVSAFLVVPKATLYDWSARRVGPPVMRIGRHLRYSPEDVVAWADEQVKISPSRGSERLGSLVTDDLP